MRESRSTPAFGCLPPEFVDGVNSSAPGPVTYPGGNVLALSGVQDTVQHRAVRRWAWVPDEDRPGRHVVGSRVIPGYTSCMKTAISVPDETFEKASRRARDLGMSRSEFFTRAAARYLDELDAESVTRQIDSAVAALGTGDDPSADAVAIGRRVVVDEAGDW